MSLAGKHIVLGISGSIAAYKAADLASKLVQSRCLVSVIMTAAAQQFVTPLTFRSLTHRPVVTDWFDPASDLNIQHVALAEAADALVVAPATADVIAKLAQGLADDPLTGTALATRAPLVLAPAMDGNMYEHPAVQANLELLRQRGATIVGPEHGRMASGLVGVGRLATTEAILAGIAQALARDGDLTGVKVVVTAGPTEEPLDPVRHITNRSSGKMGWAIAEAARDRGAVVTLIAGPVGLADPPGVRTVHIRTALDLQEHVKRETKDAAALIMAAAPADFRAAHTAAQKIKKGPDDVMTVELVKNPDIIASLNGPFVKIGFAAESEDLIKNAQAKLKEKGLDLIVANDITRTDAGFGSDDNQVVLLDKSGRGEELPLMPKTEVAGRILDRLVALLRQQ